MNPYGNGFMTLALAVRSSWVTLLPKPKPNWSGDSFSLSLAEAKVETLKPKEPN